MPTDYLIIHLNLSSLRKIMAKGGDINEIIYLKGTRPGVLLLRLLIALKRITAPVRKIKPRSSPGGPVLNMAWVRDDNGRLITLDVFHHVLALRRKIADRFFQAYKNYYFITRQKHLNTLYAYFGYRIASEITPAVYFANYARWHETGNPTGKKTRKILIIPNWDWSDLAAADLEPLVDQVIIAKPVKPLSRKIYILKHILSAVYRVGISTALKLLGTGADNVLNKLAHSYRFERNRVMVTYAMGVSKDRRTDLGYIHAANIDPARLMLYLESDAHLPNDAELRWLSENGVHCAAGPAVTKKLPGIPAWSPTPHLKSIEKEFHGLYIRTLGECLRQGKKHSWWLLERLWDMGKGMAYWKDFFIANQVRILMSLSPSENNFIPVAAISELGGIAMECERSIRFDYSTYIHNSPQHIAFITGPYSLDQFFEPHFSLYAIQSSSINVGGDNHEIPGLETIKDSKRIIAVFDESPNDAFYGDSIRELYQALIDLAQNDDRFFLLIKTKKDQVLEKLSDISEALDDLSKKGRCLRADWQLTATTAAVCSDLVISVPSTAAFESVLAGARTIVYNPMRTGSTIFYRGSGNKRRVFEDTRSMLDAVKRFAGGQDDAVGDCGDMIAELDAYNDGQGPYRVGSYLRWCLDGIDAGMSRDEIIKTANQRYASAWGQDKVSGQHSFETLCAPQFRDARGAKQ
jgi:hypothetical protein